MKQSTHHNHLTNQERQYLALPATLVGLSLAGLMLADGLTAGHPADQRQVLIGAGLAIVAYAFLLFNLVLPLMPRANWIGWAIILVNGVSIGLLTLLEPINHTLIPILLIVIVVSVTAIIQGRLGSYLFLLISTAILNWLSPDPSIYTSGIFGILLFPMIGLVTTETILRLQSVIYTQLSRMQTLNNVARSLASSLEIQHVTALVSSAIQNAMDADTYYVALLEGDHLHQELFYDDGEFFAPVDLPLDGTLAGRVVRTQKSLYIRDISNEVRKLGISPLTVGKPKLSASWMGAPLEAGGELVGMIGVASYHRNAFSPADLVLLESIAQQAAMAIINAYHHAEVEQQSQLDSLTGVYNHGSFLKKLADTAELMRVQSAPLSLIMLDIDFFKQYNDTYGHLVGDQVLTAITKTIRENIKSTDLVGRWGGEEFVIALLNTNRIQATLVARRIQASLADMHISDRVNQTVALPTVSQGIAQFPDEIDEIFKLIDLADQRLYVAKERGRNQIEIQDGAYEQRTQPLPRDNATPPEPS